MRIESRLPARIRPTGGTNEGLVPQVSRRFLLISREPAIVRLFVRRSSVRSHERHHRFHVGKKKEPHKRLGFIGRPRGLTTPPQQSKTHGKQATTNVTDGVNSVGHRTAMDVICLRASFGICRIYTEFSRVWCGSMRSCEDRLGQLGRVTPPGTQIISIVCAAASAGCSALRTSHSDDPIPTYL